MFQQKQHEYDILRGQFYDYLTDTVSKNYGMTIEASVIAKHSLEQIGAWQHRYYPWDWSAITRKFRNIPSRLELAISVEGELCGLMVGKPSRGRRHLSTYYLEGKQSAHPLKRKALPVFMEGMHLYGRLLDCEYVRLIEPVDPLIPRYQAARFAFDKDNTGRIYCEKPLFL